MVDLEQLSARESEQIEWKASVADIDDVVETLSAFANDLANLGGGYVVCGANEEKDENGFPRFVRSGLVADRLKEVEGKVMAHCRERVAPAITPLVEELPSSTPERRVLVFIQPATGQAHTFRRGSGGAKHFVRTGRSTIEARNDLLRDLLVRKGTLEPWDRRACVGATVADLDLLALRDALQRMGMFSPERGVEPYLSEDVALNALVPALCAKEPLTGVVRPRNFAVLLFGRATQKLVPGAVSLFSIYPGTDRSDLHAERYELDGNLLDQARRLRELLDVQSFTTFDKSDPSAPNAVKYPKRALYEALGNALAHRDYEVVDPTRITAFVDRIEVHSPGSLPLGVDQTAFREGRAGPRWRNQALAWFFNRLQLAQAEGQGIPTILRVMREEGCPPPTLDADGTRVLCVLPAHPRFALLRDLRAAEQAVALGELTNARGQVERVLSQDPLNSRALQLYAEILQGLREPGPIADFLTRHAGEIDSLPALVLLQLAEALASSDVHSHRALLQDLLTKASRGRLEERELRRVAVAMMRAHDHHAALDLLESRLRERPEWQRNPSLLQLRGDALLGHAKQCKATATGPSTLPATRRRAWGEFHRYLERAEGDLRAALTASVDPGLTELVHRNLEYLDKLRRENQPRGRRR